MGVFDEAAEAKRAERQAEEVQAEWQRYSEKAHEYFVATELQGMLADFFAAARVAGTYSITALDKGSTLVLVGKYHVEALHDYDHDYDAHYFTDEEGRLWQGVVVIDTSDYDACPEVRFYADEAGQLWQGRYEQAVAQFVSHFGCYYRGVTQDADAINQQIRTHYEDYLKSQL